jgi:hypothetical protein
MATAGGIRTAPAQRQRHPSESHAGDDRQGRQRTLAEYEALFDTAGMKLMTAIPTFTPFSIVEAQVR